MAERETVSNPTEAPARRVTSTAALDRKLFGSFTVEHGLYVLFIAIAIFTRLYIAGIRPLHHDESIHAVFRGKSSPRDGSYKYDPVCTDRCCISGRR
jgi:predicted membrane-bound mannosyltransferase